MEAATASAAAEPASGVDAVVKAGERLGLLDDAEPITAHLRDMARKKARFHR